MRKLGRRSWSSNTDLFDWSCWISESENNEPSLLERLWSGIICRCSFLSVDDEESLSGLLTSVELAHDVVIVSNDRNDDFREMNKTDNLTSTKRINHHRIGWLRWRGDERWWSILWLTFYSFKINGNEILLVRITWTYIGELFIIVSIGHRTSLFLRLGLVISGGIWCLGRVAVVVRIDEGVWGWDWDVQWIQWWW